MSAIEKILNALVEAGISVEDIQEAAEALEAPKGKAAKGKPAAAKGKADDKKGGKGKKPGVAKLLEDLEDDDLVEVAVELELTTKAKAKKLDRDALIEMIEGHEDEEEVEDIIADLVGDDEDEEEEDEKPAKGKGKAAAKGKGKDDDEEEDDEDEDEEEEDEKPAKGKGKPAAKGKKDEPDYDDMSSEELVDEVVKRKLATRKKAEGMEDDDLIEMLEEDDEG